MEQKKQHHLTGLTDKEVTESRAKYGSNMLTPPPKESLWKLFLEKFNDSIIRILLIAALLSLIISIIHNNYTETIGIFCAIFLATGVGFWFEYDAKRKFDILNSVNDDTLVRVIRNGQVAEISKRDVVVGDTVLLETGEEIPADGELIEALSLRVNESTLTGEPSTSKTTNEAEFKKDATYPSNKLLRGTTVIEGHGTIIVTAVGDATEFGKVARASVEKSEEKTPLTKQLEKLASVIGAVGFTLAITTFAVMFIRDIFFGDTEYTLGQLGLLGAAMAGAAVMLIKVWMPLACDGIALLKHKPCTPRIVERKGWGFWIIAGLLLFVVIAAVGYAFGVNALDRNAWIPLDTAQNILNFFMIAVTLIVVAVPEGLPMSVTLSLALNMRRMLKSNNLVRKMHACETMGAINVICTDKTGTLTQNQMSVYETYFFALQSNTPDKSIEPLIEEGIAVNSTAHLDTSGPKTKAIGNPTEAALLLWLNERGISYNDIRENRNVIDQIAFSTERKYMATLVESEAVKGKKVLYIKGAPEIVLNKCKDIITANGMRPASEFREEIAQRLLNYQNQAMRTLGFAYKIIEGESPKCDEEIGKDDFIYLGIAAISDPVRPDVPAAVKECLDAGIAVKIVTGDTPGTAREIARQIGLWDDNTDTEQNQITGVEFAALSDGELLDRIMDIKIMSRARPTDKQRLVQLLQRRGAVVAVTGDGTNDAPALNFAQVGLSMGSGTSVAKEASDITLLDDSFKSIATAVMWGRSLYKNIQRFLLFQLTINVIAILIVFLGAFFGQESPLTITQMLWVNLIMDTFAAAALASLPPDRKVMKDKPRAENEFIITRDMAHNILGVGLAIVAFLITFLQFIYHSDRFDNEYGLSIFFTVFVMIQFWNMFNAKAYGSDHSSAFKHLSESSGFIMVSLLIVAGQILIVSFGDEMFRVVPLSITDWLAIIGGTSVVLWIGELTRLFFRISRKRENGNS